MSVRLRQCHQRQHRRHGKRPYLQRDSSAQWDNRSRVDRGTITGVFWRSVNQTWSGFSVSGVGRLNAIAANRPDNLQQPFFGGADTFISRTSTVTVARRLPGLGGDALSNQHGWPTGTIIPAAAETTRSYHRGDNGSAP